MASMKKKLLKYFTEIPLCFLVAAALNPWLNVTGVEVSITQISEAFGLDTDEDCAFSRRRKTKFLSQFKELFEIYKIQHGGVSRQSQTSRPPLFSGGSSNASASRQSRKDLMTSLFNDVQNETSKKKRYEHDLDEIQIYMNTTYPWPGVENFEDLNLLEFWEEKQQVFPVLASMARDILTIQASTVASESAFSLSGRLISARRSRLTPEAVECLVCMKDYLDSIERIQDTTDLEAELAIVEENFEENEQRLPSPTNSDCGSVVSHYDDEDQFDNDNLTEATALHRFQSTGTLEEYQPLSD